MTNTDTADILATVQQSVPRWRRPALQLTIRHSALIRTLVVSTVFRRNGWYPEILTAIDQFGSAAAEMRN
jgi:hypothetical protein